MLNMEPSPLFSSVWKTPDVGKTPPDVSLSVCNVQHCVSSHPAHHIAMLCVVMLCLLYIYCFFHLFSPVDPVTDAAPMINYVDDDPSLPEQAGKPPFDHPDVAHSILSCLHYILLLYLIAPILMHILLLYLLLYLTCLS